jgi:hypothetical protein
MFTKKLLPVVVLLAVAVAGCGTETQTSSDAGNAPDASVSNTPGTDQQHRSGAQRVEPRDGLTDIRKTRFDRSVTRRGGRALDLFFWSGVEECYGVDHVDVEYFRYKIKVTIFEGRDPRAETCIELAVRKVVRVELDERVGNRTIVDGGS